MKNKIYKTPKVRIWFGIGRKFTVIFLVFILCPVVALGSLLIQLSGRSIEEKMKTFAVQSLEQMGKNMDAQIQTIDSIASSVLSNETVMHNLQYYSTMIPLEKQSAETQIRTWLTGLSNLNMEISGMYLFDRSNAFFYAKGRSPALGYHVLQQDWYKKTLEADGALVIFGTHEQFHVEKQPEMVITITRALKDFFSQEVIGVIMVDIPFEFLESVFHHADSHLSLDADTYVLDTDGTILFSREKEHLFNKFSPELYARMTDDIGMVQDNINGVDAFTIYYTSPYTGWKIASIQPRSSVLGGINKIMLFFVLLILAFIFMFLALLIYVNRRIVHPIRAMSHATGQVKIGNYDISLYYPRHDEITILSDGLVSMAGHIKELINKVYLSQLLQREAELTALQNQINPHFLYNSLECIRGMALDKENREVADMVKALSSYTRYNIVGSRDFVTIQDEIRQVQNYITIQNTRHDGKYQVIYGIPSAYLQVKIMKLTLQPLVENSILHGLEGKLDKGIIRISLKKDDNNLVFTITDNGLGMKPEQLKALNDRLQKPLHPPTEGSVQKHIGVINVHNRIRLYFGDQYGLRYEAVAGGGLSVTIQIPA